MLAFLKFKIGLKFVYTQRSTSWYLLIVLANNMGRKQEPILTGDKVTFGDGTTLNDVIIRSGYSSRIFEISRVPMPAPVPPPRECVS